MKKLQILTIKQGYGILEREAITLANSLSDLFFIEIVFLNKDGNKISYELNKNIIVKYLEEKVSPFKRINNVLFGRDVRDTIDEFKPDIILTIDPIYNSIVNNYRKIKKVFWLQNNNTELTPSEISALKNFEEVIYSNEEIKKNYAKTIKTPGIVIPSFITIPKDTCYYDTNRIVSVVESTDYDSLSDLLDLMAEISAQNDQVKLNIIGDHCGRNELLSIIRQRKLERFINIYGELEINEIIDIMSANSLFINVSSKLNGIYMIYAMSLGLPVISYSTQIGIKDIIENDLNGYIIKPNGQKEFINKTLDLISNKKALANLGACARESIRANDINSIKSEWIKVL